MARIKIYRNEPGDLIIESPSNVGVPYARYNFAGYVEAPNTEGESLAEDVWAFIGEYEYVPGESTPESRRRVYEGIAAAYDLGLQQTTGRYSGH
jgi:hypothetical protein